MYGPQIVWKILSDGNWVMMPNGCEKLSDEWWVMSYEWWVMEIEWWKLSDEKWLAKQTLGIQNQNSPFAKKKDLPTRDFTHFYPQIRTY